MTKRSLLKNNLGSVQLIRSTASGRNSRHFGQIVPEALTMTDDDLQS